MIRYSVQRPLSILVLVIIILVLGYVSFTQMSTDLLPSFNLPYISIITTYAGASPEQVETQVTKPIEDSMAGLTNLKNINSTSAENYSMVSLEFEQDADLDTISIDVSATLNRLSADFADGISAPIMIKLNPDMLPVLVSAVKYDGMDYTELSGFSEENLINRLESAEGVAQVTPIGAVETTLDVTISQEKIDKINELMRKSVSSDLDDVQDKIDEARDKIDDGEKEISKAYKENSAKILSGEDALAQGQAQLDGQKSEIEAMQAMLDEQRKPVDDQLAQLDGQIRELDESIAQLQLDYYASESLLEKIEIKLKIEELSSQRDILVGSRNQLSDAVAELDSKQAQLDEAKYAMDSAQSDINAQKSLLEQSKSALESGVSQGKKQLEDAQDVLESRQDVFDEARDKALDRASVSDVVTMELVAQIIGAQNFEMPAGYVDDSGIKTIVKVGKEITEKEELENLVLFDLGLEYVDEVKLADVADVEYSDNSGDVYAKLNGENGILYMFTAQSSYSTSEVGDNIKAVMADLSAEYPGLEFEHMMDQGIYIDIVIQTVMSNLILGAIFAVIVLFIFLRNPKPTLVVAVSIPISVVFALVLMYFSGMTMNIISLAGLALGIGMLVDNSIVVVENTYRLRALGVPAARAAYQGAREMGPAIAASTITTISVFFPIVFTHGLTRQMFSDMALTITYSLVASLIVALTVVPAMSGSLLSNMRSYTFGSKTGKEGKFLSGYGKVAAWSLRFKPVIIIAMIVAFAASFYAAYMNGIVLLPEMDGDQMSATVIMPHEMVAEEQFANVDEIASRILDIDEVQTVGVMLSGGDSATSFITGGGGADSYTVYMNLVERNEKTRSNAAISRDVEAICSEYDCEVKTSTSTMDMSTMTGSNGITFKIKGNNYDDMMEAAGEVSSILENTEGVKNIDSGIGTTDREIRVVVDRDKAMKEGLTVAQVYMDIATQISEGATATTIYDAEAKGTDVVVIDGKSYDINAESIKDMHISKPEPVASGTDDMMADMGDGLEDEEEDSEEDETSAEDEPDYIVLSDIATVDEGQSPTKISRSGQKRQITVQAAVDADYNITQTTQKAQQLVDAYRPPEGVIIENAGETESIFTAIGDLAYILIIAIVLIYLIMVVQFQSLKSPFIVMFTIPLAFTGGFIGLVIGGFELSTIVLVGMLLLAGVVVNNGIVLVDTINRLRLDGMERREAIIKAGKMRMRPIFMTALTTILGMLTLTMGMGQGAELIQPMAVCVVGGLAYATVLTLIFIPVLYDAMNKKELRRRVVEEDTDKAVSMKES